MVPDADTSVDPPRLWVEQLFDSEAEVRDVLDDVRESHLLGEYENVREQLRAFANAENGIFHVVSLTILDIDAFYDDLESQYNGQEPPTEKLTSIGDDYSRLADGVELVLSETLRDFQNPKPGLRHWFRYSEAHNLPRLDYDLYSGDVKLCEFVHPPSQAMALAQSILASTRMLLERVDENDDAIADSEQERLAMVFEHLENELAELEVFIDETEDTQEPVELDPPRDWSFY